MRIRMIKNDYLIALGSLVFDTNEVRYVRETAIAHMFSAAAKDIIPYSHDELVEKSKNLPLAEIKNLVGLVYQAILKKLGRDDSRTMSMFKAAINQLSEHELKLEWESIADGTVSRIIDTMLNFDSHSEQKKQDIMNIFEGLAVPYFRDYKGKVPKEDLEWAHKLVRDYFKEIKQNEPLLKGGSSQKMLTGS